MAKYYHEDGRSEELSSEELSHVDYIEEEVTTSRVQFEASEFFSGTNSERRLKKEKNRLKEYLFNWHNRAPVTSTISTQTEPTQPTVPSVQTGPALHTLPTVPSVPTEPALLTGPTESVVSLDEHRAKRLRELSELRERTKRRKGKGVGKKSIPKETEDKKESGDTVADRAEQAGTTVTVADPAEQAGTTVTVADQAEQAGTTVTVADQTERAESAKEELGVLVKAPGVDASTQYDGRRNRGIKTESKITQTQVTGFLEPGCKISVKPLRLLGFDEFSGVHLGLEKRYFTIEELAVNDTVNLVKDTRIKAYREVLKQLEYKALQKGCDKELGEVFKSVSRQMTGEESEPESETEAEKGEKVVNNLRNLRDLAEVARAEVQARVTQDEPQPSTSRMKEGEHGEFPIVLSDSD